MEEPNRAEDILDMVIATCDGHELREEDEIIHRGRENTEAEENGKGDPLLYVTENIARGILCIIIGCGLLAVPLQLIQA